MLVCFVQINNYKAGIRLISKRLAYFEMECFSCQASSCSSTGASLHNSSSW